MEPEKPKFISHFYLEEHFRQSQPTVTVTRYQKNKTLTIAVKIMIDFKSFFSHVTGKFIIVFFNIFATACQPGVLATFVGIR